MFWVEVKEGCPGGFLQIIVISFTTARFWFRSRSQRSVINFIIKSLSRKITTAAVKTILCYDGERKQASGAKPRKISMRFKWARETLINQIST